MNFEFIAKAQLIRHEGCRLKPYEDTVGKTTIGIGRNLSDVGISQAEADLLFENDVKRAVGDCRKLVNNFDTLSENRKAVIVNMMFNLGYRKFAEFRNTIAAIESFRYEEAADEMLDSTWARQVKGRAVELADLMRAG